MADSQSDINGLAKVPLWAIKTNSMVNQSQWNEEKFSRKFRLKVPLLERIFAKISFSS